MAATEEQVDQIVRAILAQLNASTAVAAGQPSGKPASKPAEAGSAAAEPSKLELHARVISLAHLAELNDHVKHVVVPQGAVITPSARDLLRQRKVDLSYKVPAKAKSQNARNLIVGTAETTFEPSALLRALRGVHVQRVASTGLLSVVDDLTDQVSLGGWIGLLITGRSTAAACVANRVRGVRAVCASHRGAIREAVREVGVNLLIVDPKGRGQYELLQAVSEFCREGGQKCPEELHKRLG